MMARLLAALLSIVCFDVARAQQCANPGTPLNYTEFFSSNYAGRVAWVREQDDENYYLLEECTKLPMRRRTRAYFVVNNTFVPRTGDGRASFVAIQIARTQARPQLEKDVLIDRNDPWCRVFPPATVCAPHSGFSPQPIAGISPKQFFDLHEADPFDETKLAFGKLLWHATPIGGVAGSEAFRRRLIWRHSVFDQPPGKVLFSNRLYAFAFNEQGNTGVPFDIGVNGTEAISMRVSSPLWPEASEYLIEVVR